MMAVNGVAGTGMREEFVVALGADRYAVERPWGALPPDAGKVTDVAADARGRVYALVRRDPYVDAVRDPVHALDREGRHLASWGRDTILDAHMIAVDASGRVWVVDRDAHEIVAFEPDGRVAMRLGRRHGPLEPFNHPSAVAFGPDGTIAVGDGYGGARVHLFDPDGRPVGAFGTVGTEPGQFLTVHGISIDRQGRVLVADRENNRVQVFTREGTVLAVWTGFHRPSDIWCDPAGRVFVTDGVPTLTMLSPDGERLGRCRPVNNGAHGLFGGTDGSIYLAEGNPSRLTRLRPLPHPG